MDINLVRPRFSLRLLRRRPGLTFLLFATLASCIGFTVAAYSVLNAVLWKTLPVQDHERLVLLETSLKDGRVSAIFPYPLYRYLRDLRPGGMNVAGRCAIQMNLQQQGEIQRVSGEMVTGNYFGVLGLQPSLGRLLQPSDDEHRDGDAVCVLSHGFWKRRFGASESVLGQTLNLNGREFSVVGVVQEHFSGIQRVYSPEVFVPSVMQPHLSALKFDMLNEIGSRWIQLVARRSGTASLAQVQSATDIAVKQFLADRRLNASDFGTVHLLSGSRGFVGMVTRFEPPLLTLAAVLALLLLVAVINLANIFLAAALEKRKEIATRLALGARPADLAAQMVVEIATLTVLGTAGGVIVSLWMAPGLLMLLRPITGPLELSLQPDLRVLLFIVLTSVAVAALLAAGPALSTRRVDVAGSLKSLAEPVRQRFGHRSVMAGVQIALSFLLLLTASLLVRTLGRLTRVETGFTNEPVLLVTFNPVLDRYSASETRNALDSLTARLRGLPFVRGAAWARNVPLSGTLISRGIFSEGSTDSSSDGFSVSINSVSPGYFATMSVQRVAGREFESGDDMQAPRVAIINEALARRLWPDRDALGQRLGWGRSRSNRSQVAVVGVVRDVVDQSLRKIPAPLVYTPLAQEKVGEVVLHLRLDQAHSQVLRAVRQLARETNPPLTIYQSRWLGDQVHDSLALERILAAIASVCGVVAWLLASFGLYALISYTVTRRTREFGLRVALGAEPRDIARLVVTQAVAVVGCGALAGVLLSLGSAWIIRSVLFGVSSFDYFSYLGALVLVAAAVVLGGYFPVRGALRADPATVLRVE